jgi:uncharacterized protein (DUF433 family)
MLFCSPWQLTRIGSVDDTPIQGFRYLVTNPERLGGKPMIRGTRFSVPFILACLADGITHEDIVREYSDLPCESLAEALRFAAEGTGDGDSTSRTVRV